MGETSDRRGLHLEWRQHRMYWMKWPTEYSETYHDVWTRENITQSKVEPRRKWYRCQCVDTQSQRVWHHIQKRQVPVWNDELEFSDHFTFYKWGTPTILGEGNSNKGMHGAWGLEHCAKFPKYDRLLIKNSYLIMILLLHHWENWPGKMFSLVVSIDFWG